MKYKKWISSSAAILMLSSAFVLPGHGQASGMKEQDSSVTGYGGAVASEDPDASNAGMQILKQGGNAVDAAIAVAAAQGVTRPFSGGIGGGGMMLIHMEDEEKPVAIDSRSISPQAFDETAYTDEETGLIAPSAQRISSGAAFSIPGTVKNWEEALDSYGTMSLEEVLAPAIEVAEEGFEVDANFVREVEENVERFRLFNSTRELFLDEEGNPPEPGDILKNQDLANTYRSIAEGGSSAFYEGKIAGEIIETINQPPLVENPDFSDVSSLWRDETIIEGNITPQDLADYETRTYDATHSEYKKYDIYGVPPSSSGGITIGETFNILDQYKISKMSKTQAYHYFMEATRLAIADRREYIGDPEKAYVPTQGLLSKGFAQERNQQIKDDRAAHGQIAPGNPWPYEKNPNLKPDKPVQETDFSYDFNGNDGEIWSKEKFHRLDTGPLSSPDDASLVLENNTGKLSLNQKKEGRGSAYGRATANMDTFKNPELKMSFRASNVGNDQRLRIWLQGDVWRSGSSIPENGYGLEINTETEEAVLLRSKDSRFSTLKRLDFPLTTEWHNVRFVEEDNNLKVGIWEEGEEEPDEWLAVHPLSEEDQLSYSEGKLLLSGINFESNSDIDFFMDNIHVQEWENKEEPAEPAEANIQMFNSSPNPSTTIEEEEEIIKEEQKRLEDQTEQKLEADESTIHASVSDRDGNIASYTTTIVSIGGNGMVVPDHGFLLNNALYGRTPSEDPSHPNYPRPGMRSLSSMSPTLVMEKGKPVLTLGAPGSDTILTTVSQIMMSHLDFNMSLPEAFAEPRVSQRNNFDSRADYEVNYWNEEFENMKDEWEEIGHRFSPATAVQGIGAATGIEFHKNGKVTPTAEAIRRGGGSAIVESDKPIKGGNKPVNGPPDDVPGKGRDGKPGQGPPDETPGNGSPDDVRAKNNSK
ncbi:gamma-glutamyltransferase [Halobacillus campisalis]|uniref:Gamma-glutamyltransferase n=1 Tax=Halobacillus campisalis TaxID=435909 RepID=A0ABW2K6G9_9BACI|nr:gamma-glutamyltransferase [Halobacillus campisalis]